MKGTWSTVGVVALLTLLGLARLYATYKRPDGTIDVSEQNRIHDVRALNFTQTFDSYSPTVELLATYISQHNASILERLSDQELCRRNYVIGTYSCPKQIGNRMHEFLNAFAGAVITNRTLLWNFCDRFDCEAATEQECAEYLQRYAWMPKATHILKRLQSGGCYVYSPSKLRTDEYSLVPRKYMHQAHQFLACTDIAKVKTKVVSFGVLEVQQMAVYIRNGTQLSPGAQERAQMLFFGGIQSGYGMLFRCAFDFTTTVKVWNAGILSSNSYISSSGDIIIGAHRRHPSKAIIPDSGDDAAFTHFLYDMVRTIRQGLSMSSGKASRCTIYLATDRAETVETVKEVIANASIADMDTYTSCDVIMSPKGLIPNDLPTQPHQYTVRDGKTLLEKLQILFNLKDQPDFTDHGIWADGLYSTADIELVSHADYFVGSWPNTPTSGLSGSTYSLLIAELVASKILLRDTSSNLHTEKGVGNAHGDGSYRFAHKSHERVSLPEVSTVRDSERNIQWYPGGTSPYILPDTTIDTDLANFSWDCLGTLKR
jgi:hypothetical protein